jgi:uncharacterized BrkB/YihY/UPF0761 family membrane protein
VVIMSAASSTSVHTHSRSVERAPWPLIKCAVSHWSSDQAATIGAALAFYCAFSIAPLLVILLATAGWIVGAEAAYGHLSAQLTALFGKPTASILLEAMRSSQTADGKVATVVSIGTLLLGATTVFAALESALEQIWGARELVPKGFRGWVRARILSFGLILAVGFLLLVSLSLSTALAALREAIGRRFTEWVVVAGALDFVISTALVTGLIALIYRYMPARPCGARSSRRCCSTSDAGALRGISAVRRNRQRSAPLRRSQRCCCGCTTPRRSSSSAPSSRRASAACAIPS